jgi:hypothetical protein
MKLNSLKDKLTPTMWQPHFEESLEYLTKLDKGNILSIRKETLGRVFSTIKYLNINFDELVFLEVGVGAYLYQSTSDLFASNIAEFFLNNKMNFEYLGVDSLLPLNIVKKDPEYLTRYMGDFRERNNKIILENKIPIIFSNLVVGFNKREDDLGGDKSYNPAFWNLKGLHIHQYLIRDVVRRENNLNNSDKKQELDKLEEKILNSDDFNKEVEKSIQNSYDIKNSIYSEKISQINNSNVISFWLNEK